MSTKRPTQYSATARRMNPMLVARTLALSVIGGLIAIAVALSVAVDSVEPFAIPAPVVLAGQVVAAAAAVGLMRTVGFQVSALSPELDPEAAQKQGIAAYQSSMMLRLAVSEVIAVVSIALTFVLNPTTVVTYLIGAAISVALIAYFVYPRADHIRHAEQQLDRDGGRSRLAEAYGLDDRSAGGAILH